MVGFNPESNTESNTEFDYVRDFTDDECKTRIKELLNAFGLEYLGRNIPKEQMLKDLYRDLYNQVNTTSNDQLIVSFEERKDADISLGNFTVLDGDLLFLCFFSMSEGQSLFPSIRDMDIPHNCKNSNVSYASLSDEEWKALVAEDESSLKCLYYREDSWLGNFLLHIKKDEFEGDNEVNFAGLKAIQEAISSRSGIEVNK